MPSNGMKFNKRKALSNMLSERSAWTHSAWNLEIKPPLILRKSNGSSPEIDHSIRNRQAQVKKRIPSMPKMPWDK